MPASIVYFLNTKKMKTNVWNVNQQFAKYSICYLIIYSSSQTICCLFIKKCFGLFVIPWEFVKNCWKCRDNFWAVSSESKAWVEVSLCADWIMCYAIIRCISLPSVALHAGMSTAGWRAGHRVENSGEGVTVLQALSLCLLRSHSRTIQTWSSDRSVRRAYHIPGV